MLAIISILSVVSLLTMNFIIQGIQLYKSNETTSKLQENVASVMREFEYSTRAASQITTANNNELVFLRYYDLVSIAPIQVHYFMDGSDFKVGKALPVGTPPTITYPNEEIVLLIKNVKNPNVLFSYFDEQNTQLSGAISLPTIRMIGLSISLDDNIKSTAKTVDGTTRVSLRNMKTNL